MWDMMAEGYNEVGYFVLIGVVYGLREEDRYCICCLWKYSDVVRHVPVIPGLEPKPAGDLMHLGYARPSYCTLSTVPTVCTVRRVRCLNYRGVILRIGIEEVYNVKRN